MDDTKTLKSNLFTVHIKDIGLPEWLIASISDKPLEKKLVVEYRSGVFNGKEYLAEVYFYKKGNNSLKNGVDIDILDEAGTILYKKHYNGCKIVMAQLNNLDYGSREPLLFNITIEYDTIEIISSNDGK